MCGLNFIFFRMKRKISFIAAALCCALLVSCGERHAHGTAHSHETHEHGHECHEHEHEHGEHHEACLQLTAYSDHWEVYAEASPLSTEEESHLLVHVTRLEDFKPLTEGKLCVQLLTAGKNGTHTVSKTLQQPEQPGIYHLHLQPEKTGKASLRFIVGGDTLDVDGLQVYEDAHCAAHEAEERQITQGAAFPKEKSWKVDFATENCRRENFGRVIRTVGQIQNAQNEEQLMVAPCSGIVHFAQAEITEGRDVNRGTEVFAIDGDGLSTENASLRLQQAEIEYRRSKETYERKKELAAKKIISESELQTCRAEFQKAEAGYENLRKNFRAGKTRVKAPLAGHIRQLFVQNGQYVEAGEALAVIGQNRDLFVRAEVPAAYYRELRNIQGANFRPMHAEEVYRLDELDGKVISYGQSVSEGSGMLPVTFRISNRIDLLPGSFIETYILTRGGNSVITVDRRALVEEMGNYFVYVQLTPERFDKREVSIGATDGLRTEIRKGLQGNERVVSKGAMLVKLAQASATLDAHSGHHH